MSPSSSSRLRLGAAAVSVALITACTTTPPTRSGVRIGVEVDASARRQASGMPVRPSGSLAQAGLPEGARMLYPSTVVPPTARYDQGASLFEWQGDGRTVSRIRIDRASQRATFFDGDEQIGWAVVATGKAATPTPRGTFRITEKQRNKRSNLYGRIYAQDGSILSQDARTEAAVPTGGRFEGHLMPFWMRLTNDGVGLHAGYIPNPGSPASYGCIRLPLGLAPVLFAQTPAGTLVEIL